MSVWHVNCCNPEINGGGGWGIFNAIFGWTNSATYGSVLAYNLYWLVVIGVFCSMTYYEKSGHWPLMKAKAKTADCESELSDRSGSEGSGEQKGPVESSLVKNEGYAQASTTTRELRA